MTGEIQLFSVFVPTALLTAIIAGALIFVVRRLLARTRFYRLIWHPGLFDLALFVLLWSGVSFLADTTLIGLAI